ncbi:potassium channel family protein [Streptomyces sp. HNM0574]|uniref:potassium channel family protein n=1 Tax=Streptomyces sp. HNM0574 TaxID=2714954 RepID=UPI00146C292B|nr:potassium channel family protein [Streptomyces sp. HNM0574]NLU69557.1 two pore domain potassium channel family protein [Streptomyces sp. HNM0574]
MRRRTRAAATGEAREVVRGWWWLFGWVLVPAVVYFLLPVGTFGPHRPVLSWAVFTAGLALIAALLLRAIRDALTDRPGARPVLRITVLVCLSVLVFATAYLGLAHQPGEMTGRLRTHIDALYFTLVSTATVGYGDIAATGQSARLVVVLQILYSLVFLTAAATAVSTRVTALLGSSGKGRDG